MPDAALGADQGRRHLLAVNKDYVVEQREVEISQREGALRSPRASMLTIVLSPHKARAGCASGLIRARCGHILVVVGRLCYATASITHFIRD